MAMEHSIHTHDWQRGRPNGQRPEDRRSGKARKLRLDRARKRKYEFRTFTVQTPSSENDSIDTAPHEAQEQLEETQQDDEGEIQDFLTHWFEDFPLYEDGL